MKFPERLRGLREKKGLSQTELGKLFNLSKQAISSYETEGSMPTSETLQRLSNFFNTTTDYLLGLTNDPTPPNNRTHQKPSSEVSAEKAEAEEIAEMIMKLDKWERQTAKMIIGRLGNKDEQAASKA